MAADGRRHVIAIGGGMLMPSGRVPVHLDYAMRLTGDASHAEDVVQETLLRAWQHPEVVGDTERSARAWLFTVARNMIIDDRRSARYRNVVASTDVDGAPEQATPDEVNSALDRLLIADAEKGVGPMAAEVNDPRVTRVGRLLRSTAMDELPQ